MTSSKSSASEMLAVFAGAIILAWLVATIIAGVLSLAVRGIRELIKFIRSRA